jgi:integrase/recombinase XerD
LCLFLRENRAKFHTQAEETVQQFIYAVSNQLLAPSGSGYIESEKFFGYLIFEDYRTDNPLQELNHQTGRSYRIRYRLKKLMR